MAGPNAVLFNHETNTYEEVPAEQVGAAIASGRFTATGGSVETQSEGGLVTRPIEQLGAAAVQGESDAGGASAQRAAAARREVQLGLTSDKVLSFVEGAGDAMTLGLMHGTSEEDELRREADSGSALLGQLVGTAVGLKFPGPIRGIVSGGEKAGEAVARALLGEASSGFRGVVSRGIQEASANAALMAASAFGHQITDAVIADKPFAAESIGSEAGVGALLGFGFGAAGSVFGQLAKASRSAVEASGIVAAESRAALEAVDGLTRSWDNVVEQHAQRVGMLKVLADDGHIPGDMHSLRSAALREAEAAREALRSVDQVRSMGGDAGEFQKWRGAVERYQDAVTKLDESMSPSALERAHANPIKLGSLEDLPRPPVVPANLDQVMADRGFRSPMSSGLDKAMTPEARAAYQEIYGRPFEETPGVPGAKTVGEENLGGRASPTSEVGTNPGTRRRGGVSQPDAEPVAPAPDTVVDARVERFNQRPAKVRSPHDTAIDVESRTIPPREVLEAGTPPASKAETAREFVDSTKRRAGANALTEGKPDVFVDPLQGKKAVRDYLNGWFREFDAKPRVSVGDQLQTRLMEALDKIAKASGSRLDSAGSLDLFKALGIREATSPLGSRLDQVWSLGQAGKFAADESRGIKTPLRKGLAGQLQRYASRAAGRTIGSAVIRGALGGPIGAIMGTALAAASFSGIAASTAGKLMQQVAVVGEALLRGNRATLAVRAAVGNRPYQYSEAGPLKDPVARILEVQRLAANSDAIRARVVRQLGDLALTSPELAQHIVESTVNQVQIIAASGPAIAFTPLGKPIQPSGTALNKFYSLENAVHDLPGTLQAIARGGASNAQIRALQVGYPAVHQQLVREVLGHNEDLDKLNTAKLRAVERVLGISLTRSTLDPTVTARFQNNWESPKPAPTAPQAFKITAPKPTTVQSASGGRAPGNERIAR